VDEMIERVGMTPQRLAQIGQLSGGQQQRVFIARALAQQADVLLLDEPMNGIDAATQEVVLAIIEEQRSAGKIVLLATHDLISASCACDCLCCVNERMVSFGPVEETYNGETLAETYGGPVIMLGRANGGEPAHTHHDGDHAHHRHEHEPLGHEHD
jgi:manganese/zinc/iron transport system ATP- binding protein